MIAIKDVFACCRNKSSGGFRNVLYSVCNLCIIRLGKDINIKLFSSGNSDTDEYLVTNDGLEEEGTVV